MYLSNQSVQNQNWDSMFNDIEKQECLMENSNYQLPGSSNEPKMNMKKKPNIEEHFIKGVENKNRVREKSQFTEFSLYKYTQCLLSYTF